MKKITLLLFSIFALSLNAQTIIWDDNFESYPDWEIAAIDGYTLIDIDLGTTYGSSDYDYTNEGYVGTAIIWNPSAATPDASADEWNTHEGLKGLYFFASGAGGSTTPNNDWVITPQIDLTNYASSVFSFWAQSVTDFYGLERMEVAVSTTGTAPGDFTVISPGGTFEEVPIAYAQFSYDLTAYDGEQIYLAIHYVSNDSFVLQMDEFLVEGTLLSLEEFELNKISHTFNQDTKVLTLESRNVLNELSIYNILGQEAVKVNLNNTYSEVNLLTLQPGIYIAKIIGDNNASKTIKLVIK